MSTAMVARIESATAETAPSWLLMVNWEQHSWRKLLGAYAPVRAAGDVVVEVRACWGISSRSRLRRIDGPVIRELYPKPGLTPNDADSSRVVRCKSV